MAATPYNSQNQVRGLWDYLDGISRKVWENLPDDNPQRKNISSAAGDFYNQLLLGSKELPQEEISNTVQPPFGKDADNRDWSVFARNELIEMLGRNDVRSIADAFLKTKSLLRRLQSAGTGGQQRFLFRGQRDISWSLLPRKGRALLDAGWQPPLSQPTDRKRTEILPEELESLAIFRNQWDSLDTIEDEDRQKTLPPDHPEWWFRMQHYDPGDGTRLLDLTTSLTAALLFASVDWSSGKIDTSTDGIIYLWPEGQNGNVDDFLIHRMPKTADGLFSNHPDAPRFILNPPHNERSKAQSGAFLWWPKFWEEPPYQSPFFLRVPSDAKTDIVRDLLSMGFGPKEAVRGIDGLKNEQLLRSELGLPNWSPLQLAT